MSGSSLPFGLPTPFFALAGTDDPFAIACARAEMPEGLLGRFDPPVWNRLAARFGKLPAEWCPEDWEKAARILGFMVYQTEESERSRKIKDSIRKRPGPKPRPPKKWQGAGLLDFPPPSRGGRPPTWKEENLRELYALAEHMRRALTNDGRRATDKAVLDLILDEGWRRARQSTPKLRKSSFESIHRGRLRNALTRAKKIYSKQA